MRELYRGKSGFFASVIFPFIDWVASAWNYADKGGEISKYIYSYEAKQFVMSKSEHDAFDTIVDAVGSNYYVFPQVHLSVFLNWKVRGQNWNSAMRHINQKSVDFLLCDKKWINPKLAIELDDATHEREERKERDGEVERILKVARFPLLRIHYSDLSNATELKDRILKSL